MALEEIEIFEQLDLGHTLVISHGLLHINEILVHLGLKFLVLRKTIHPIFVWLENPKIRINHLKY